MLSMSTGNDGIVTSLDFDGTNLAALVVAAVLVVGVVMVVAVVVAKIKVVGTVVVAQRQSWRCTQW